MLQLLSRAESRGRAEKPGGQLEDDALSSLQVKALSEVEVEVEVEVESWSTGRVLAMVSS